MVKGEAMVDVNGVTVCYHPPGRPRFEAVRGVSFSVQPGEIFGIVGESGCGKSSLARALTGLNPIASGSIRLGGLDISRISSRERRRLGRRVQMIFQDAAGSLNPRKTIWKALEEVFRVHDPAKPEEIRARVNVLLDYVGLPEDVLAAYPRELSGGQCQRVSIARCLALSPALLVADEPVSALDVSVQARVLNLLGDLRSRLGLTLILISHDLAVVRTVCDRVAVMQSGEIVEMNAAGALFANPAHPYTKRLLAAVPDVGRALAQRTLQR